MERYFHGVYNNISDSIQSERDLEGIPLPLYLVTLCGRHRQRSSTIR